jgi:pimeloyl-ACP methyl ester carboxylesterase
MAGAGRAVVFQHGGLLDRRQWDTKFAHFAKNYRPIRYDMRSAGWSETTPTSEPFAHHEDLFSS